MNIQNQNHFKRNWDLYIAVFIALISFIIMFSISRGCNDFGCVTLFIILVIGVALSDVFIGIAIYRQFSHLVKGNGGLI